ncbi:hypothetical protein AVEN_25259-1 [Araneus ventricosus]|uniref:Uncharacterized protein n=1 Tax=Araneus ventricosus TaxID=182803 RepID=A0A4Y2PXW0_ARAVE|nr:hypothetical protein AVEN_25259-1 [Araneus ventricosus]
MSAILKNKGISDDEKVKLYMQVLQKRLNILDHNNIVQETISEAQHTEEEKQDLVEKSALMEQLILESAPKIKHTKYFELFKKFSRLNALDSQGRIIYKGKNVKNSNVLDFIKSLQTSSNKAHPPDFDMFLQGLSEMNFPKCFIINSSLELDSEIKKGRDIAQETKTHKCKIK